MDKPRFIGRAALERTAKLRDQRRWMGFTMDGDGAPPPRGLADLVDGEIVGNVTGSWHVPGARQGADARLAAPAPFRTTSRSTAARRRDAHALLRPGGPPCPRLSRSGRGIASSPSRRPLDAAAGRGDDVAVCASRPTTRSPSARGVHQSTTSTRSSSPRSATSAVVLAGRGRSRRTRSSGRCRPIRPALAQGSIAGVPAKLWILGDATVLVVAAARLLSPTSWLRGPRDDDCESSTLLPIRWRTSRSPPTTSSSSAAAATACRPPTTSRPGTGSRTWPSSRPTTSPRATPAATRRSSAPTTASPRRSASTSTRSSCTRPSRTRPARHPPPDQGHLLDRPHRDGDAHRARRCPMNTGARGETVMVTPAEIKELVPQIDLTGGGRYPVLGASHHLEAPPPATIGSPGRTRPGRRSAASTSSSTRRSRAARPRGRPGRRRRDAPRADRGRRRPLGRRRSGHAAGRPGRRPAADPDPSAPRVRDQRLRSRASGRSSPAPSSTATSRRPSAARCSSAPSSTPSPRTRASRRSTRCAATPTRSRGCCRSCATCGSCGRGPGHLRHLGRLQPDHGLHRRRRLPHHDRLGDVGLQGHPGRRRGDGRADRHRPATPELIAPFSLDRFRRDHVLADQGSAGTR